MASDLSFLSVSETNRLLKAKFEGDDDLQHLTVKGEISSWKAYPSATYFDIKDDKSTLSCILWGSDYLYLTFEPKLGDEVLVTGNLDIYVPRGRYSLMATSLQLFGQGSALLALEALKKKLQAEGLFDESRKRSLPAFPKKIGMIVGDGSAAEADLLKNLQRRWPLADLYVFPSLVQGKEAPKDLLRAFRLSQSYPLDVLIIARGGGSNEDLSAFNDEALARAVATSKMPTISAIGHEIDFSIVDFVADKRVSTPTGAAEAATPDANEILQGLLDSEQRLDNSWTKLDSALRDKLTSLSSRPFFKNPASVYQEQEKEIQDLNNRLLTALKHQAELRLQAVEAAKGKLKALNPYGVLNRGYSLTSKADGSIVRSIKDVASGDEVKTRLKDGIIHSKVE
jgi:exodeoxyribonuclease VII large subunit